MDYHSVDVVIVGGGPGGLSAALVLGRSRRNVYVIDSAHPRNEVTFESHGFLTRDGIKPFELRELAHEQMKKYQIEKIVNDLVTNVNKNDGHFEVTTEKNLVIQSKKLIFATGLKEFLPTISGLEQVYGKSVFSCPYCDGWEHRDQALAVIGNEKTMIDYIRLIYNWSHHLIVTTNGQALLSEKEKSELTQHRVRLIETPIKELISENGVLQKITFVDGESVNCQAGFLVNTGAKQATMLPKSLGVTLTEKGAFETEEHGRTAIEGLFIIGDAAKRFTGLIGAASEGYETGVCLNHDLVKEEWLKGSRD